MKKMEKPVFKDNHTELEKFMIAREDVERMDKQRKFYRNFTIFDFITDIINFFAR